MGRDGAHEAKRASHGQDGDGQMPADLHSDTYECPGRFPDPHEGAVRSVRDVLAAAIHPRRFETERHGGAWNETERTCGGKPNQPPIRICFSSVNDERSPPLPQSQRSSTPRPKGEDTPLDWTRRKRHEVESFRRRCGVVHRVHAIIRLAWFLDGC